MARTAGGDVGDGKESQPRQEQGGGGRQRKLAKPTLPSDSAGRMAGAGLASGTPAAANGRISTEAVIASRLRAQLRAVWLLQRDLQVPEAVLVQARHAPSSCPDPYPIPTNPLSLEDQLVVALSKNQTGATAGPSGGDESQYFRRGADGMLRPTPDLPQLLASKREKFMQDHMKRRQHVLEKIPSANMPHLVADRCDRENKALRVYELQQRVRNNLLSSHVDVGIPPPSEMALYRKERPTLEGSREEAERQWRLRAGEAELRSKAEKHKAFLEEMSHTQKVFQSYHATLRRNREILVKAIKQHFKNKERAKDKEKLDRLAALKANDFDKYREYVKKAKNERLMELIARTDGYLATLASKMSKSSKSLAMNDKSGDLLELNSQMMLPEEGEEKKKKEAAAAAAAGKDEEGEGGEEKKEGDEASKIELAMEHVVKEVVIAQPSIMGGPELRLKPYQIQGVQWMVSLYNNHLSGILADEMGLGKTIQVIGLLTYLFESKGDAGPFLIIAPLSTITNWAIEFQRWAPTMDVIVYKGSKEVRRNLFKSRMKGGGFNVCIIQYEMVMKTEDLRMLKTLKWSYCIVDEGHRLKNKDSKLFTVLTKEYHTRRKVILTGTPLQNNITELWNLLNFLLPQVFDTDQDFKTWFSKPFALPDEEEVEEEASSEEQMVLINRLHQVLRPFMLRRVKTDEDLQLSMPENREVIIKCSLSGLQKIMYYQLQHSVLRSRDDKGNLNTKAYNNIIIRLRQVCNHPYLLDEQWNLGEDKVVRVCGKFDVLDRILPKLKEAGHRVLIYSQMVKLLDVLQSYVEMKGYPYRKLIGATSSEERAKLIEEFNEEDSKVFVFLLSTRAGGQGVNLQTADTVIIFDSDWNPMMDEQAKARINRIGQTKQTLVIRLITPGTVEERMLNRASARLRMGELAIESGVFKVGATSKEAQQVLKKKLDEDDVLGDIGKIEAEVATDEDMNELIMRSEEEFQMWQKMDQERDSEGGGRRRLMEEWEVPEELLGEKLNKGDRVVLMDDRPGVVREKKDGNDWEVELEDGSTEVISRTMLSLMPEEETEESLEASRLGRRRNVNRAHSVSHHGLTDAEFTKCLEQDIDMQEFARRKRERSERGSKRQSEGGSGGGGTPLQAAGGRSGRKRRTREEEGTGSKKRKRRWTPGEDSDEEEEQEESGGESDEKMDADDDDDDDE